MLDITRQLHEIKTATYGKNVRGALIEGLDVINKGTNEFIGISQETQNKQISLESRWESVIGGVTEDAEVIDARQDENGFSHTTIGQRIEQSVIIKDFSIRNQIDLILAKEDGTA
ncbi:hypothetical protein [Bacillus wiedmannii]|uniref:hypothetical protein n=1 Tax=Bacillus wiedmannii TaxID=1890302 RepID=UPI0021CF72C5|nr:hypothetical protein [Bacillus wiedmannii]MCU5596794.1 hypothetical protein [Bacillus wiedmannii]